MKIAILLCGHVHPDLVDEHGQYSEMVASLLDPHHEAIEYASFDVTQEQFPRDNSDFDAVIISGSHVSVYDDYPWIKSLETYLQALIQTNKKIIGICFGHQILAQCLGGEVIKSPKGWGIGSYQTRLVEKRAWMHQPLETLNLLVSHQDQVVKAPTQANILYQSSFCPNYMMQIDEHILTVQGHPEFKADYLKVLIKQRLNILSPKEYDNGLKSLQRETHDALFAKWMLNFIEH